MLHDQNRLSVPFHESWKHWECEHFLDETLGHYNAPSTHTVSLYCISRNNIQHHMWSTVVSSWFCASHEVCVEKKCTFALLHHGFRLGKRKTLHGLITRPSCAILHSRAYVAKLHQHPTVKGVTFLTRGISSPWNTIRSYTHTHATDLSMDVSKLNVYQEVNRQACTTGFGQVFLQLLTVLLMQDVIDTGVDQLLLLVLQILSHVIRHKHDVSLSVHDKQEAIQCLKEKEMDRERDRETETEPTRTQKSEKDRTCLGNLVVIFLTCNSRGPRWSLSMTPWPVEDTSAFWTSSSPHEPFPLKTSTNKRSMFKQLVTLKQDEKTIDN